MRMRAVDESGQTVNENGQTKAGEQESRRTGVGKQELANMNEGG